MTRAVPGPLAPANRGAAAWSSSGLVAFGCQCHVVVLHAHSAKLLTTLTQHKQHVTHVCWRPENVPHGANEVDRQVRLASADAAGQIVVWDVHHAVLHAHCHEHNTRINDLQWYPHQGQGADLLLSLHPPYSFVLWNANTGERLWKKSYTESLHCFAVDPFNSAQIAFATSLSHLMLVDDFHASRSPSGNGRVYRVACNSQPEATPPTFMDTPVNNKLSSSQSLHQMATTSSARASVTSGSQMLLSGGAKLMRGPLNQVFRQNRTSTVDDGMNLLATPSPAPSMDLSHSFSGSIPSSPSPAQCLQIHYHQATQHVVLLVFSREVVFVDTGSLQTLTTVQLDRHMSPFVRVHACKQLDAVYFVQENGSVTLRVAKYKKSDARADPLHSVDIFNPVQMYYESVGCTESLRITKTYRVSSCVFNGASFALVMTSGRVTVYTLMNDSFSSCGSPADSITQLIQFGSDFTLKPFTKIRFVQSVLYGGVGQQACVLRARPEMQDDQHMIHTMPSERLLAVATSDGYIQLINAEDMCVEKEFSVHSSPIRLLEWGGSNRVLSAGYSQTLSTSSVVRNEILCTDIRNGLTKTIRPEVDESPVELLRASFYHSYLAISFKEQPMEIWDLHAFRLLRRMSRACPIIVDMAWSGKHHNARTMRQSLSHGDAPSALHPANVRTTPAKQTIYRENLVVLDNENHLYHVVVKGMHVKDGKEVNTQWATTSAVTAMVWKGDYLAFGDSDGRLSLWDLGTKQSRASRAQRGAVKSLRFARAARNYTLVVLHADGIAVWDAVRFEQQHSVVHDELPVGGRVLDVDVCGWDQGRLALLTSDVCVRLLSTHNWSINAASFCPTTAKRQFSSAMLNADSLCLLRLVLNDSRFWVSQARPDQSPPPTPPLAHKSPMVEALGSLLQCDSLLSAFDAQLLLAQAQAIPAHTLAAIESARCIPERCMIVANLLGDSWEHDFWQLVDYQLNGADRPCPPHLLTFAKSNHYKRYQMLLRNRADSVLSATGGRSDALALAQRRRQALALVSLGELDAAVQLLLSAQADVSASSELYADSVLACLLSADHSSTACQSTVKLVATNLIAAGKLTEGVLLLCLIGMTVDACRYLQSAGEWSAAAALAQTALDDQQCQAILAKWAEHSNNNDPCFSLLLYVSMGDWSRALHALLKLKQTATACLLLHAVEQHNSQHQQQPDVSLSEQQPNVPLSRTVRDEYAALYKAYGLRSASDAAVGEGAVEAAVTNGTAAGESVDTLLS